MESVYKNILVSTIFITVLFLMGYILPRCEKKISELSERELIIRNKLSNKRDAVLRYRFSEQDVHMGLNTLRILQSMPQNTYTNQYIEDLNNDTHLLKKFQLGYLYEIVTGEAPKPEEELKKWNQMNSTEISSEYDELTSKVSNAFNELKEKLKLTIDEKHTQENKRWWMLRVTILFQLSGLLALYLL